MASSFKSSSSDRDVIGDIVSSSSSALESCLTLIFLTVQLRQSLHGGLLYVRSGRVGARKLL